MIQIVTALNLPFDDYKKCIAVSDTGYTTSRTITIPNGSMHLLFAYYGTMNNAWIGIVQRTSTGGLRVLEIAKGSNLTVTTTNDTFTVSISTANTFLMWDTIYRGSACS